MTTIVTRSGKGSALTYAEVDANFTNLNADKAATADVILATQKGAASGVCPLDATSKVASTYLPSYVDDVLEYANLAALPVTGETGKIYVALDTNKAYRWSGSAYIYITSGAVDSVAGRTGVITLTSTDVGLANASNTSDANKPVSTATQTALDLKAPLASPTFTGTTTAANLAYTGTLTGSTGILNIGSGQVYKDASGNVGIGTSSPVTKLDVSTSSVWGTSTIPAIQISNNGSAGIVTNPQGLGALSWNSNTGTTAQIEAVRNNPQSGLYTSLVFRNWTIGAGLLTETMRIDSSGNVGIGTISPVYKLDVRTSVDAVQIFASNGTVHQAVGYCSAGLALSGAITNHPAVFITNNTERMRIDSTGNVTLQKNISVGGAAPTTVGTGITFPAAQSASSNANTLDDYEEGTWVPVTSAGIVFVGTATKTGFYTKIGNVVKATFYLQGVTSVTIAAASTVSLPFITYAYDIGQSTSFGGTVAPVGLLTVYSTSTVQYITALPAIPNIVGTVTYTTTT